MIFLLRGHPQPWLKDNDNYDEDNDEHYDFLDIYGPTNGDEVGRGAGVGLDNCTWFQNVFGSGIAAADLFMLTTLADGARHYLGTMDRNFERDGSGRVTDDDFRYDGSGEG